MRKLKPPKPKPTCCYCGKELVRFAAFICEACARVHLKRADG